MTDTPTLTAPAVPIGTGTYTVSDIARLTQASERHVHRMNDLGMIPGRIKGLGRLVRFGKAAIDAWLAGEHGAGSQEVCNGR